MLCWQYRQRSVTLYLNTVTVSAMATSRLANYILSEEFHRAVSAGVREAVARARAAGVEPPGISRIEDAPRIKKLTTIDGPPSLKVTVLEDEALEQWLKIGGMKRDQ